jgi:hypothetical protein
VNDRFYRCTKIRYDAHLNSLFLLPSRSWYYRLFDIGFQELTTRQQPMQQRIRDLISLFFPWLSSEAWVIAADLVLYTCMIHVSLPVSAAQATRKNTWGNVSHRENQVSRPLGNGEADSFWALIFQSWRREKQIAITWERGGREEAGPKKKFKINLLKK